MSGKRRMDTLKAGWIPGLILPVIGLLGFWMFRHEGAFVSFLRETQQLGMLDRILSLSALPNLLLFFVYIWVGHMRAARGVVLSTFVVALVMLILKIS